MSVIAKCIKTYGISLPQTRFIGKRYHEEDKRNGTFSWAWEMWSEQNLFAPLKALMKDTQFIESAESPCGLCRNFDEKSHEYWIGMFLPAGTEVPEGYESLDIPACGAVVNWIYGKEPDVYFYCCMKDLEANGYQWKPCPTGERLMTERYVCPRFSQPDENGNRVLDQVFLTDF